MDLTSVYRFPFTNIENPNTVIEPTTKCNLSCPGCYRVEFLAGNKNRQLSLDEMKQYVDDVIAKRNTNYLSFLGGEPMLHPQLNEAIVYAKKQGLGCFLCEELCRPEEECRLMSSDVVAIQKANGA